MPDSFAPSPVTQAAEKSINAGKVSSDLYGKVVIARNQIQNRQKDNKRYTLGRILAMLAEIGLDKQST